MLRRALIPAGPHGRADRLVGGLLLAVASVITLWRGGFSEQARGVLVVLAGMLIVIAAVRAPDRLRGVARAPLIAALLALAVASLASATWTVAAPGDALRAGATIVAFAAIAATAGALSTPRVPAAVLLAVAVGAALIGLGGLVAGGGRYVVEVCGTLRPAGPFEYPPALALVAAGALAPAAALALASTRAAAAAGGAALVVLSSTVALAGNRTGVVLAAGVLVLSAWVKLGDGAPSRAQRAWAGFAAIAAGGAIALLAGPYPAYPRAGGWAGIVLAAVLMTAAWSLLAPRVRSAVRGSVPAVALVLACAVAIAGSVADERSGGCATVSELGRVSATSVTHGRLDIWRAALASGRSRPLYGHGAGSFLVATGPRQIAAGRALPTSFAHDLPLELWVELGALGVALALALYGAAALALTRACPEALALLGPFVAAFMLSNLLDWPWHLPAVGVLWAIAAGGLLGARRHQLAPAAP